MNNLNQSAIKGMIWSAIEGYGSKFSSIIIFFFLVRLLEPESFGLLALANSFLGIVKLLQGRGFGKALIQRQNLEQTHIDTAFWTNLCIACLLTIITIALAPLIADLFKEKELIDIIRALSLFFTISSLSTIQQALLQRQFLFKSIALRSLLGNICGGIVGIIMAVSGFGVWSLVCQKLVDESVGTLFLWRVSGWQPKLRFSVKHFQDLAGFGFSTIGFKGIDFFNYWINEFSIGYFLGTTALGYYAIALGVYEAMMQLLVYTIRQVALPFFSRLQNNKKQFNQVFDDTRKIISIFAFPSFLAMAVLAPEVVIVLFGQQWVASIPLIQILSVAGAINSISFLRGDIVMAVNDVNRRFLLTIPGTVLNLIGLAIAIRFGIVAVAIATLVRRIVSFPIGEWIIASVIDINLRKYLNQFLFPLVASVIMVLAIIGTKQVLGFLEPKILLVICSIVGFIVYSVLTLVFARDTFFVIFNFIKTFRQKNLV